LLPLYVPVFEFPMTKTQVGAGVFVGLSVYVGVPVGEKLYVGVFVAVAVVVKVEVNVSVEVGVKVGVKVIIYVAVPVLVIVEVDTGIKVAVPVAVAVLAGPEGPAALFFLAHPVISIKNIPAVINIMDVFFTPHLPVFVWDIIMAIHDKVNF
jgi:hypothetical protein